MSAHQKQTNTSVRLNNFPYLPTSSTIPTSVSYSPEPKLAAIIQIFQRYHRVFFGAFFTLVTVCGYAHTPDNVSPQEVAQMLGWVNSPDSMCHGYYQEAPLAFLTDATSQFTDVHADHAILNQDSSSTLEGHVVATQKGRQVTGDSATNTLNPKTHATDTVTVHNNVRLHETGVLATADQATMSMDGSHAVLHNSYFRVQIAPGQETVYDANGKPRYLKIEGKNYRGHAQTIEQTHPEYLTLDHVILTTCNPYDNIWKLKAEHVNLDQASGLGDAYNTRLLFYDIPIFYTPFIRFPIDNRRRTGFLGPDFYLSSHSGTVLGLPFYVNLAPNYDMTLYPYYYSLRGPKMGASFDYLTDESQGQLYYSLIHNDAAFSQFKNDAPSEYNQSQYANEIDRLEHTSNDRYQFLWNDKTQFNDNFSSFTNIDYVNDDYYLQDFGNAPITSSDAFSNLYPTTQLAQSVTETYANRHFSLSASMQNFQTLHPVTLPSTQDQYARLPEIDSTVSYPDSWLDLDYAFPVQYVQFANAWFEPYVQQSLPSQNDNVLGARYNASPNVSYWGLKPWGYVHPTITFDGTDYALQNTDQNSTNPVAQQAQRSVAIPLYDIDSGLYFDRTIDFGTRDYTETLEPRLYYLYVPYVDQDALPVFDTSENTAWTYEQLFQNNRFMGVDRIGDANQASAGVTTRFINNDSGNDVLDMSLGQSYYFANQQVQLDPSTPPDTDRVSPVVGELAWQLNQYWSSVDNIAYNPNMNSIQTANAALNYQQDPRHMAGLNFSYVQPVSSTDEQDVTSATVEQLGFGSTWQITPHWQLYGAINYNFSNNFAQTYLYGAQYNSCCWAVRVINSENFIGFQPDGVTPMLDHQIAMQFVLTGLTSLGTQSAQDILQYSIPNYIDTFGQQQLMVPRT